VILTILATPVGTTAFVAASVCLIVSTNSLAHAWMAALPGLCIGGALGDGTGGAEVCGARHGRPQHCVFFATLIFVCFAHKKWFGGNIGETKAVTVS